MKCNQCGAEWKVPPAIRENLKTCPFCGASLPRSRRNLGPLAAGVADVLEELGLENLSRGPLLMGTFLDLAPERKREQQMLRLLVEMNGHTELIQALSLSRGEQITAIERLVYELRTQRFMDEKIARSICVSFFQGIGGSVPDSRPEAQQSSQSAHTPTENKRPSPTGPRTDSAQQGSKSNPTGGMSGAMYEVLSKADRAASGKRSAQISTSELFHYGNLYYQEKKYIQAIGSYRAAAERGHAAAQFSLGNCFYYAAGIPQNYKEAAKWYFKAARQGYAPAQFSLGRCLHDGHGLSVNYSEAVRWYRKAAEQDHAAAQSHLGDCYLNATGVPQNDEEAAKWYFKAAVKGDISAQYMLGFLLRYGRGLPQNLQEAAKWYLKAAEKGHPAAQSALGECYYRGFGVSQSIPEAIRWFQKAAEQGDAYAMYRMGFFYHYGVGVPYDRTKALNWYHKAVAKGSASARNELNNL